jgi:parallel beta-helix repeat protein
MEPKSIAFYTAVAVSILAVLSATTFPTLAQAQTQVPEEEEEEEQPQGQTTSEESSTAEKDAAEKDAAEDEAKDNGNSNGATNGNGATSESLGLMTGNGVASCGQIVTEDVTLTSDLDCGNGEGLIVGASGVTINLNGYSISSGDDASSEDLSMDYDGSSGILVSNADDVAITGLGEIIGFDRGVTFMGSSGGQVTDLQLADNGIGVLMSGSTETELSRNTITNNGIAAIADSSNEGVVAFNQIVANVENGILLLGSDENVVAANNMFGNGENGIYLDILSNGNTVDYNTVFGHEMADMNNAGGQPTNVNQNSFGDNNNCGTSNPGGLCR